jgi:5-methylcytosine-specific restriction endonuclease McrA
MMNVATPSTIEQLRARDGDNCWLCDGKLSFNAPPNSKKSPTREHLLAKSLGGTEALDNLVLCHPGCNKHLGIRPKAEKLKMRDKCVASRAAQAAIAKPVKPTRAARVKAVAPAASVKSPTAVKSKPRDMMPSSDWQSIAMIATASATFFAGLCLGMLIG